MSIQSILAISSAGLAALYFIRGAYQDLSGANAKRGGGCGKCSSGGCPVASK